MVLHIEREPYDVFMDIWTGYATDNGKTYFLGKCITTDIETARDYFEKRLTGALNEKSDNGEV